MSPQESKPTAGGLRRNRSTFERFLLAVSLVSIAAVIGGLFLYSGDTAGGRTALSVEVNDTGRIISGGPEVQIKLTNKGDSGADDVIVEVKMGEETREISFVRIAKDEQKEGAVVFPPEAEGTPEASILSYNYP